MAPVVSAAVAPVVSSVVSTAVSSLGVDGVSDAFVVPAVVAWPDSSSLPHAATSTPTVNIDSSWAVPLRRLDLIALPWLWRRTRGRGVPPRAKRSVYQRNIPQHVVPPQSRWLSRQAAFVSPRGRVVRGEFRGHGPL